MLLEISLLAGLVMLLLALFSGYSLGWANKTFHVEVDPKIAQVNHVLPGANCGGCGYIGCADYASAIVLQGVSVTKCPVGGESCAKKIADIMGVEVKQSWPYRPVIHCAAKYPDRLKRIPYAGEATCIAANLVSGIQGCVYGCLGYGDCVAVCKYDAIHIVDGLSVVDYEKCIGCGACAKICPRNIITMVPFKMENIVAIACSNKDFMNDVKSVCNVGCIGCKACERLSPIFKVANNLPSIDYNQYDPGVSYQAVVDKCPRETIIYVGKPSQKDKDAVSKEEVPKPVEAQFKTTVDSTEWRG
ncbi:MAG: RnfABCDGE type electron transport complex subunit B [Candidatus Aureabacteria bacterium]|nr:RnfABCDGE type electron transport complex subunit B [Candidatus Auribacterota bacterium]